MLELITVIVNAESDRPESSENNLSPIKTTVPEENEELTPPTTGVTLFTGPDPPSQIDEDDFQSVSDETDTEADLMMELDAVPPITQPVKSPLSSRKPGKIPDTIIPQRRATQPTLVTGSPVSSDANLLFDLDMTDEHDVILKRKPIERPWTNKHKKRK